jgi:AraC-like DNA-binding protein
MPGNKSRELSDLRALLEGFGAACAARRAEADPASMAGLRAAMAQIIRAVRLRRSEGYREADMRLHEAIMEMAGVPGLVEAWRSAWEAFGKFYQPGFGLDVVDRGTYVSDHEYLVETIKLGDPVAAEEAARNHVEATWVRLSAPQRKPGGGHGAGALCLALAVRHMAAHLQYPLRLGEMAAKVAFTSPRHLSRLFRRQHGMGFKDYLQKLRMAKAAELLAGTRLPVGIVARRAGYHDMSLFAQHFARHHGLPPRAWRKQKRADA